MLDRNRITELLALLAADLDDQGLVGELFLVGGGAMALAYDRRRATKDLDAVFEPASAVRQAAARVAVSQSLPPDWLNDAVKGFLPGDDPASTVHFEAPGLRVRVASPGYLFTLKAVAARAERDSDDLLQLYRLCGFASADDALDHVEATLPSTMRPAPKTMFLLRELFENGFS